MKKKWPMKWAWLHLFDASFYMLLSVASLGMGLYFVLTEEKPYAWGWMLALGGASTVFLMYARYLMDRSKAAAEEARREAALETAGLGGLQR